ncbi:BolA/IbaG family iron-sulfur metabolism protein [Candidatus Albibeggiatoa sp. nov. BB20]|uniref:BolA family protein n=1 Tax=Candidatus Albibeggiatoa sp. nov. BB20 TaxID=3162723 RepID=UPI0033659019
MTPAEVKQLIESGIENCEANVQSEDNRHFQATVISNSFAGQTLVKQHQMVYATLGNTMQTDEVHALALTTRAQA